MSCVGYIETKDSSVVFHGDVTAILSTTAEALTHGGHWLVMWSVMSKVRDLTSCVSRMSWIEIWSSEGIVEELHLSKRKKADGNTCNSLRRSGKSYDTTTGCAKTLSCQGEMVVAATSNGRD